MNYREIVNSKAKDYKQYLLNDLKKNIDYANIVNSVFFPENFNIQKWLEETEVNSFYNYSFKGQPFFKRVCTRQEIDNIHSVNKIVEAFSRYAIFSFLKCNDYEEALVETNRFYHIVQKEFYTTVDKIILDRLQEYKRENGTNHFYTKKISDRISLTIGTAREHMDITGIIGYNLPSLSIKISNEDVIDFGTIDVRTLLFLPERSFLFFYLDSYEYNVDLDFRIVKDVTRKNDEPAIYYLEDEQKYMVTNTWENINRYNKYIQIILELSFHYFNVFEKWLTQLANENDSKI